MITKEGPTKLKKIKEGVGERKLFLKGGNGHPVIHISTRLKEKTEPSKDRERAGGGLIQQPGEKSPLRGAEDESCCVS